MFLRHASPWILLTTSILAVSWRLTLGAWSGWDGLIALVLFVVWPFQEWMIHVYVLHFRPRVVLGVRIDPANSRKHRRHHRDPTNIPLLFIPLHTYLLALPLVIGGSLLVLPNASLAATTIAVFLLFSLHYEWCHFLAHVPYTPKLGYYRHMCQSHCLHHFRHEQNWFGVSRTFADRVLGTAPDAAGTELSPTVKTLGVEA